MHNEPSDEPPNRPSNESNTGKILVIGPSTFLRECVGHKLQTAFSWVVQVEDDFHLVEPKLGAVRLVAITAAALNPASAQELVQKAALLAPNAPPVIFSLDCQPDHARSAIQAGAKGYVPMNMGTDPVLEAVRFVLAGGVFIPAECFLAAPQPPTASPAAGQVQLTRAFTQKEMGVIGALRRGKSNKLIAFELGCSETTVKVHLRNIMRKVNARNRTEVAIRTHDFEGVDLPVVARSAEKPAPNGAGLETKP